MTSTQPTVVEEIEQWYKYDIKIFIEITLILSPFIYITVAVLSLNSLNSSLVL